VEEGTVAQRIELGVGESELLADPKRDPLDTERVSGGIRILCIDGGVQGLDRLERALLEQPVGLEELAQSAL
jgi:hypothetical protein